MSGGLGRADCSDATLAFGDISYTPTDLRLAIERAKADFRCFGITARSVVVLNTTLTDRHVIALLALVEMECCVVPVAVQTPKTLLDNMIASTSADAIVTDSGVDSIAGGALGSRRPSPLHEYGRDCAYVLFTSGTTGRPKGVVGSRRGLAARIDWGSRHFFSTDVRRCAITTSPGFIDGLTQILAAYKSGRSLLVAPVAAQRDLGRLCDFVDSLAIEQITLTPSCIPVLCDIERARLQTIRRFVFSGEELRRSWLIRIRAACPAADVVNSYGSTEVCGDAVFYTLPAGHPAPEVVPIGKPMTPSRIVVDGKGVANTGVEGELWIGGDQVALGYLQGEASESERFTLEPDGSRWFRTGDLVRERDGQHYFAGRIGDVDKIRGNRVDLSGVAVALESIDGVHAAHAWISRSRSDHSTLRAAVIPEAGFALTSSSVLSVARERLLPFLVPDRVDVVRRFLRNANGKIDVRKTSVADSPPRSRFATGVQHAIASFVSQVLDGEDIWPTTSFAALGLDSLRAVQVADGVARYLGADVTGLDILAADTVYELAQQIPAFQSTAPQPAARIIRDGPADRLLVFLHPAVGSCIGYFGIVRRISYQGRIAFVEQSREARRRLERSGMGILADYYAETIATLASKALIDVVGYSFGAILAPAVAAALADRGHVVSSVVLMDPAPQVAEAPVTADWAYRRLLTDAGYRDWLPHEPIDLDGAVAVVRSAVGPMALAPAEQLRHWADCLQTNMIHCRDLEPGIPTARTLLVTVSRTSQMQNAGRQLRAHLTSKDATVLEMDCSHFELLYGEHSTSLASEISKFLGDGNVGAY